MKTSNIYALVLSFMILIGMVYTNVLLKKEYSKIDLDDAFKNYVSQSFSDYSVLHIEGSNGYPIEIKSGPLNDVKVLRSRMEHFFHQLVNDTLFITFTGANISMDQAFFIETPAGIIIEKDSLSKLIVSNTFNRISNFENQKLEVELKNASFADFSNCRVKTLNLSSEGSSQFVFSEDNNIDSLNLDMKGKSVGHLHDIEYKVMNHSISDSVTMVLSKKLFDSIRG